MRSLKAAKRAFVVLIVGTWPWEVCVADQAGGQKIDDAYTAIMATKFDFSETSIGGDIKTPNGFFLQGRKSQSLSQMVRLRSAWKLKLRNSRAGVQAAVK